MRNKMEKVGNERVATSPRERQKRHSGRHRVCHSSILLLGLLLGVASRQLGATRVCPPHRSRRHPPPRLR